LLQDNFMPSAINTKTAQPSIMPAKSLSKDEISHRSSLKRHSINYNSNRTSESSIDKNSKKKTLAANAASETTIPLGSEQP
jgi:hypothetical protein